MTLADESCTPCRGGEPPLAESEWPALLAELAGWRIERREGIPRLVRTFSFPNWRACLRFAQAVGELAEVEDHHPEIAIRWGEVEVSWWTHAVKGLHRNDFVLAARCDRLAGTA
ncbi:MAG: pterin-4-alpha-carbinolamine dehydratase [Porticoccaceae bacterium]|nr:MAG: pterin-4-alpha-carbinolamine dehydratase [Porticoccaceae bacterium]